MDTRRSSNEDWSTTGSREHDRDGHEQDKDTHEQESERERTVTACETRPGRTVFTHSSNTDAWIATDLTVTPEP